MSPSRLKIQIPTLCSGPELLQKQAEESLFLPSGSPDLDDTLLGRGLPRGAFSLLIADPGLGATSFWLQMAAGCFAQKKWALWMSTQTLFAPAVKSRGLDLQQLYVIRLAETQGRDFHFVLRECLESRLFTLIGCEVESLGRVTRLLPRLRGLIEASRCTFLFVSRNPQDLGASQEFRWMGEIKHQQFLIHKTKNRPPFSIPWRGSHARLLSELSQTGSSFGGGSLSEIHSPSALSRTGPSVRGNQPKPVAFRKFEKPA